MANQVAAPPAGADAPAFLDADGVARRYSLSVRHLYRLVRQGEFPQPRKVGRLNRWALADLHRWEAEGATLTVSKG